MLSLYFRLIGAKIRSQMQYRVSFWLDLAGFGLTTSLEFAVVVILLARFQTVGGWSVTEVALLYGLASVAFGLAEMIGRGFDAPFERMMQEGTFDTLLIRPHGSFFQVLASEFQLRRLGRVAQGMAALLYALLNLPIHWTAARLLLLPVSIVSGMAIYMGLVVIGATICFWTIRTPEVINVFTFGGLEMMSYPLGIYSDWLRGIVLFVVPIAFVNYPAALFLLGRSDPHGLSPLLAWAAPLVAGLFFGLACAFWRVGVRKYTSAGS